MYKLGCVSRVCFKNEILSGLTVALALVPEAVAFAFVAGVEPLVGLYAAFMVGLLGICAVAAIAGFGQLTALTWIGLGLFSFCHFELLRGHPRPERLRALVAFAFGLAHGFGFAGILMEIDLPAHRLIPALFGFNIGVELGQLLVVLIVWPLLRLLAKAHQGLWYRWLAEAGSAGIAGLGIYWVVLRNWG